MITETKVSAVSFIQSIVRAVAHPGDRVFVSDPMCHVSLLVEGGQLRIFNAATQIANGTPELLSAADIPARAVTQPGRKSYRRENGSVNLAALFNDENEAVGLTKNGVMQ